MNEDTDATEKNTEILPLKVPEAEVCQKNKCTNIKHINGFNNLLQETNNKRELQVPEWYEELEKERREVLRTCEGCKIYHGRNSGTQSETLESEVQLREQKINNLINEAKEWKSVNGSFIHRGKGFEIRVDSEEDGGVIYLHAQLGDFKARFTIDPNNLTVYVQPHAGENIPVFIKELGNKDKRLIGRFILGKILEKIKKGRESGNNISSRQAEDAEVFYEESL